MSLAGEMDRWLGGRAGEPPSWHEVLVAFEAQAGSGRKAAKLVGIDERSWRRWKGGGTTPKAANLSAFDRARRLAEVRPVTLADIRIRTTERGSRGQNISERKRDLRAKNLKITDPAAADRIRAAYVDGGGAAAAAQLLREIRDPTYRRMLAAEDRPDDDSWASEYGLSVAGVG